MAPVLISLKRLRQQLNVRPNSADPTESTQATKSLSIVYAYVEESPEFTQLFKIWEWQQQHDVRRIESLLVEVFSKLIYQCNTALHRPHAIKLTRSILQNQGRMTTIYKNLSSGRQNTVQATLRLLTAMNHVHYTTTRELKDGFNFGLKVLSKFKNQRRKEDEDANKTDTRTLYIQFLLAFFVRGDATVKKEIMEMPDLLQAALKDLHNDAFPLVNQVLTTIINHIILDNNLPRTAKISFFSTSFLINQLKLYTRSEEVPNVDQTIAQLFHNYMVTLCTTPGVGICFQDAAWYPPSTIKSVDTLEKSAGEGTKHIFNKTLSQLLTHLRPTEHILQQKLVVSILTACPELVRQASIQLEPRLSARWLANMTLLHKITEIPVPNLYLQHTGLFASHPPLVSTIIENILPTVANRIILSKGLQHSSMLVRYFTIVELAAVFQKTEQVIEVMQSAVKDLAVDEEEFQVTDDTMDIDGAVTDTKTTDPPAQQWANAITLLLAELRRRVPDIQIIISLHNGIQSTSVSETDSDERTRLDLFNNGVLRLIKYYQQFLPLAVSDSKFDIGKLIPSDFSTVQAGTLIHLLELLLALNDFRWTNKAQDSSSSHLLKLFSLFLTTAHPQIKVLTRRLISKLLGESILFQHDPNEANLWVESIPVSNYGQSTLNEDQTRFLQFLDDCIARCLKTPYKYVDQSLSVLKTLQKPLFAEHDEMQDETDTIAWIFSTSQYQDFSQSYSPLIMTILEQYQHVYAKESSRDTACLTVAFLQRLLPKLICNHNRTSAFAIECLNRIQDPTREVHEKIQALSIEKRTQIGELAIPEYLAMAFEDLQGGSTQKFGQKTASSKAASGSALKLLETAVNPSEFISELQHSPASIVSENFRKLIDNTKSSVTLTDCLKDYIETRFPFAGSIYDFSDISTLTNDNAKEGHEGDPAVLFLKNIPFHVLFNNAYPKALSRKFVQDLLCQTIGQTEPRHTVIYGNLIIRRLAAWIQSGDADNNSIQICFDLLTSLLRSSKSHDNIFTEFKTRLWESFILREMFLYQTHKKAVEIRFLDMLDSRITDLIVVSTKPGEATSFTKVTSSDLLITSYYIRKTVERVVSELENTDKAREDALNIKTVKYFSRLAFLCSVSDLTMLLQSLLGLHRQSETSVVTAFSSLLSTILKHLTQHGGSASAIPAEQTTALLNLWREQPSDELDGIVLELIYSRLWPNAMARTTTPLDLSTPKVFSHALNSLHGPPLGTTDVTLVNFILDHPNQKRTLILASLMTASTMFRQKFADAVAAFPKKSISQRLENPGFFTLLHAYLNRVSCRQGEQCIWSASVSEKDRISVRALRQLLLPKLVQHVANSHKSTQESNMVAEIISIFIALTTNSTDEDEIAIVWELVEKIPRIGLDSTTILSSILDITKGLLNEQQQDRQDRLSMWFERTARQLTEVLDKNGDAEWLEPLCDRLYDLLEKHVIERKLSIDQKTLFELVSFAIEKAVDNVELIRFSACLAKHYYVETSQSSALPQILQTLFKHRQFSSLAMATAPTTRRAVPENEKSRLAIIELIYTLTSLAPETCCKAGFIPTLLTIYSASTSVADQLVLSTLRITEAQTAGSISNRAPLWGSAAENVKSALFGQAMINESLDLIDPNVMMISVVQFPFDRELECSVPRVTMSDYNEELLKQKQAPVYDPCFMLPLFGTFMSFGNLLDCRRLIECNGLGMIVAAMSSTDDSMRSAAYSLMDDFYTILLNATLRERNQLVLLLDSLKNSIEIREDDVAPPRIPAVITTFVAHALASLLKPDHFMYPHVNRFCLQRPTIDLEDIPMFYSMFNSSSELHRKERVWMLRLLATSLKTMDDYRLFKRRHVVDLLVAFFNSRLSEPLSKKIVIEVTINATASENEFSLVPARLLLRVIQSCPKENIRWMNGIWRNQVAGVATTSLRQLSTAKVTSSNLAWALASIESILDIFVYLEAPTDSSLPEQQVPTHEQFFTSSHAQILLQFLIACEQVMIVLREQCPVEIPKIPLLENHIPTRSDPLESLYRIDPIPVRSHSRVIRLGFTLLNQRSNMTSEQRDFIFSRALCYRIEEAIELERLQEVVEK
ncbi:hypothetical protein BGZ76_010215 [Entomortierella beljakovae]|nr:hypothetical protein BGZ76_010215 [Entomortierella beljakovae]